MNACILGTIVKFLDTRGKILVLKLTVSVVSIITEIVNSSIMLVVSSCGSSSDERQTFNRNMLRYLPHGGERLSIGRRAASV